MNDRRERPASYQDVLDAPDNMIAQVIDGVLHLQPRPTLGHANTTSRLLTELLPPYVDGVGGPGGWVILNEPELHFARQDGAVDILVPDLAGWRRERLADVPNDAPHTNVAPDWVCEVVSPSTRALDRSSKRAIYLREGVGHVWLVDPVAQLLEVYAHAGDHWEQLRLYSGAGLARAEPFPAVMFDLLRLWTR